jgi:putative transposase
VHGISTRAVDGLVRAMGGGGMSKSQVSRLCTDIDVRVNAFLNRQLEVAVAVNEDGKREVLGVATGPSEANSGQERPSFASSRVRGRD